MAKLHTLLISTSLVLPAAAYSLGLGKMNVLSGLNQPLEAEIEIVDARDTPIADIHVQAASQEYFDRLSMERSAQLNKLAFKVAINPQKHPVIRVTSTERMTDPYMQLLLDVSWNKGKYYRAYNVLLDPVTPAVAQQPENIQSAHASGTANSATPNSVTENPRAASPATANLAAENPVTSSSVTENPATPNPVTPTVEASFTNYGKVPAATNLWKIAESVSEKQQVSINQAMLGIAGANPKAFIHGNINGLKSGLTLKIPSQSMLQSIDETQATREVDAQNKAWKSAAAIEHTLEPPYYQSAPAVALAPTPVTLPEVAPKVAKATEALPPAPAPLALNPAQPKDLEHSTLITSTTLEASPSSQQILQTQLAISAAAVGTANQATQSLQAEVMDLKKQNAELQAQLAEQNQSRLNSQIAGARPHNSAVTAPVRVADNSSENVESDGINGQAQALDNPSTVGWANKLLLAIVMMLTGGAITSLYWQRRRQSVISPEKPVYKQSELMPDHMPILTHASNQKFDPVELMNEDRPASKLDLATAYLSMGDRENAKILLEEVIQEGTHLQKEEAQKLLATIQ